MYACMDLVSHCRSLLGSAGRGFEDVYYSYLVLYKRPRPRPEMVTAPAIEGAHAHDEIEEDADMGSDALYDIDADELFAPSPFDDDDGVSDIELRADDGGTGDEDERGTFTANLSAENLPENGGGSDLAAFTMDSSGNLDLDASLSMSVRNSANRHWSRIIQNPSKEKKGLVRLHLVRLHSTRERI